MSAIPFHLIRGPHRVGLVLPAVEFMTVVENVLISRVETSFHAILHHLAGSGRALEFLYLKEGRQAHVGTTGTGGVQEVAAGGSGFKEM